VFVITEELAAINDSHLLRWKISCACWTFFDLFDQIVVVDDSSEDGVLSVEVRSCSEANEELGAVRVWSSVGHG